VIVRTQVHVPHNNTVELSACSMPVLRMVRADSQLIRAAAHFHVKHNCICNLNSRLNVAIAKRYLNFGHHRKKCHFSE